MIKYILFTFEFVSLLLYFSQSTYLHPQEICDEECLSARAKIVSKFNNSRTLILYGTEDSLFEYNELKENEEINSYILQDIFELIDFYILLESQGISEYTDLGKFFQKSGISFIYPQNSNLNSILNGSLNLREIPLDLSLSNSEKILFLKKNPPEVFKTDTPIFNENRYSFYLVKFLINKYYKTKNFYITRDTIFDYYSTNSEDLKAQFQKLIPVSQSKYSSSLEKIWNKNFSISPDFPGNGYRFIEYPSKEFQGYYSISNEGEIFLIRKNHREFIYIYNKKMDKLSLLRAMNTFLQSENSTDTETSEKISEMYSGNYTPVSLPNKGYIYFYSIFHPVFLESKESKLILHNFYPVPLLFEHKKELVYSNFEIKEILLSIVPNSKGDPEIIHISLGKNTSLRKIQSEEYYIFILPLLIGFLYFSFIFFVNLKYFRKHKKLDRYSLLYRIKLIFLLISSSIILFIVSLIFFLLNGKILTLGVLGFYLLSLNGIISLFNSILLYFIYQFFINIQGNLIRKMKYGFFLIMIFFYYFFLFKMDLIQFDLRGLALP